MNQKKTIYEPDEIRKVINFLKAEKNIISLSESNNITTIPPSNGRNV